MIEISRTLVEGFETALHGMRNAYDSWNKSDSYTDEEGFHIGENDNKLAVKLAKGGPVHGKFLRMIVVWADIKAPLYWWSQYDTYKVGTVANSCSKMHTIHKRDLTIDDFSTDHLNGRSEAVMMDIIKSINMDRALYVKTNDQKYWYSMIQTLPESFMQKRTVMLNYEVLRGMYVYRKNHKLDEWHEFCDWIKTLPESWLIIGGGRR